MKSKGLLAIVLIVFTHTNLLSQIDDRTYQISGSVYDEHFNPLPYTHVIASGTASGDMTDSLGVFSIRIRENDKLTFLNITCQDTTIEVNQGMAVVLVKLRPKIYALPEAKIFNWGATYGDLQRDFRESGIPENLGAEIGLPRQDPGIIPFDMDEKRLKSAGFLISSPISFFYYNLSKHEKSLRKAYKLNKNQDAILQFNQTLSPGNVLRITGIERELLDDFMIFLNSHLHCDYRCSELELTAELQRIWILYQAEQEIKE